MEDGSDDSSLRTTALQNVKSIVAARQRAEQDLAQMVAALRATLEATTDAIIVTDRDARITQSNRKYAELWRIPAPTLETRDHRAALQVCAAQFADPRAFLERVAEIYETSPPTTFDVLELADQRLIERTSSHQLVAGENVGRVWSFRDVTVERRGSEALRLQREWFEVTLSSIGDAVIATDTLGNVTFLNPVAVEMTGWSAADAHGQPIERVFRIINEMTRQPVENPIARVLREGVVVGLANSTVLITRAGRQIPIEDSAAPIRDRDGNVSGVIMVFHDVTVRRKAADSLRESRDHLQLALAAGKLGDWRWDVETDLVTFGARGAEIFNIPAEPPITWANLRGFIHEDDRESVRAAFEASLAARSDHAAEYRTRRPSGDLRWVAASGRAIHARDGAVVGMSGVVRDVTDERRARLALEESERHFRAIFDQAAVGIAITTLEGRLERVNQRFCDIVGYSAAELRNLTFLNLTFSDDLELTKENDQRLLAREIASFSIEKRYVRKDGVPVWSFTSVTLLRGSDGSPLGFVKVIEDIGRQKEIEFALQAETQMLELLNLTGQAIASQLDLQTLVQTVTDAATRLSGAKFGAFFYNVIDARGESFLLYALSGAPREAFDKFGLPRNTGVFDPTFRGVSVVRSADITQDPRYGKNAPHQGMPKGHLPVRSYLAAPVVSRGGEVIGGLFFGHPETGVFTERAERLIVGIAAHAATAIDNARLFEAAQREITERRRLEEIMRAARDEADRANRAKDEFLAVVSHELRTPLNSMLGWSRLLASGRLDPAKTSQGISVIERNVTLQAQLIDDLLDLSRIVTGKLALSISPVDVRRTMIAAIDSVRPAADAKQIEIVLVDGSQIATIAGDAQRLQQVFWNLLSNAVKFTPKRGSVDVVIEHRDSRIHVEVRDNGQGIAAETLPHVFDRFRQGDSSTTRVHGGLGLGLAIVRHLVEQHGGEVRADSAGSGKGSTFTIELPIRAVTMKAPEGPARGTPPQGTPKPLEGRRVLVVEDDLDSRSLLMTILEMAGATTEGVASAVDALTSLATGAWDVVISDIGMPEMDGYALVREIRGREPGSSRIPAVALTAFAREEDAERALAAGFDRHFAKPVEAGVLVEALSELTAPPGAAPPGATPPGATR